MIRFQQITHQFIDFITPIVVSSENDSADQSFLSVSPEIVRQI
jgi:hypothetical protein